MATTGINKIIRAIDFQFAGGKRLVLISLIIAALLTTVAMVSKDVGIVGNAVILAVFAIAVPQFLIRYEKFRTLKEMEKRFPLFMRDIIESLRSGMPLHQAIKAASRVDYGKLSDEVRRMANQLSWGMTVDDVLEQFADRVKGSKRLFTSIKIIRESRASGGDVVATMDSISDNSNVLEDSEKERKTLLNQYVVMMYAISLIFIVIVAAINNLMIPIFEVSGTAGAGMSVIGLSNPCNVCNGFECVVCSWFETVSVYVFAVKDPTSIGAYYTSLFFFMSMIQAFFSGLVAGQISDNSIISGFKHSLILTGITFGAFSILLRIGLLGV